MKDKQLEYLEHNIDEIIFFRKLNKVTDVLQSQCTTSTLKIVCSYIVNI